LRQTNSALNNGVKWCSSAHYKVVIL